MNPRLSMNVMTTQEWDLGQCVDAYARLGIPAIGLTRMGIERYGAAKSIRKIKDTGLRVSSIGGIGPYAVPDRRQLEANVKAGLPSMDIAAELQADCLYVVTGPRGALVWDEAAKWFGEGLGMLVPHAQQRGVRLAVEPVHPLRQDLTFINTARDAFDVITPFDSKTVGYVFDFWHCWWERDVLDTIAKSARRMFAVQPDDHKKATRRTMDRAMLGEGVVPVRQLLQAIEKAGYRGYYDIEIISDDIAAMGNEMALKRIIRDFDTLWSSIAA